MFFQKLFCLSLVFLFCSCGNTPTVVKNDTTKIKKKAIKKEAEHFKSGLLYGIEISKGTNTPYDDAYGKWGDTIFISSYKGKIVTTDSLKSNRVFILDLDAEFMVDKIFILPLPQNKWFVTWQETDHLGVQSYAAVFKSGAEKPEWQFMFDVPNPGIPVLDGGNVYVTYLGIVAKISTTEGRTIWKRDSLFNTVTEPFKKFEQPRVFENKVEFVDYPRPGHREKRDTLTVNPLTGENFK